MRATILAVVLLCVLAPFAVSQGGEPVHKTDEKATPPTSYGRRRMITVEVGAGASVPVINVAKGRTTTLMFEGSIRSVDLLDVGKLFAPPPSTQAAKTLYLTALRDPGSLVTTLMVVMASGAELPFQLVGSKEKDADVVVDVVVAKRAGAEGTEAFAATDDNGKASCCMSAAQLRQQLDDCQASTSADAIRKIAQLILSEDSTANSRSVVFEGRRSLRALDKQSGLLVEATGLYRMFGSMFLILSVENRLADRTWVLDKAQVRLNGAGADVPLIATIAELTVLPPSETERIVVVFSTPAKRAKSAISVTLLEKGGNRNVTLDSVEL